MAFACKTWLTTSQPYVRRSLELESRMRGNVPVRFGRGRLDSLVAQGLAAYLITSLGVSRYWAWTCDHKFFMLLGLDSRGL